MTGPSAVDLLRAALTRVSRQTCCAYCGLISRRHGSRRRPVTCYAHRDLPSLDPRYQAERLTPGRDLSDLLAEARRSR